MKLPTCCIIFLPLKAKGVRLEEIENVLLERHSGKQGKNMVNSTSVLPL